MPTPLVSIVIPCYNHENFVQECIQSVIDQTYQNIELIIIDDGSKDSSVKKIQEMVSKCTERFVRFEFRYRSNKGLSATLNEAIEWCRGRYFSPLASDDLIAKDKIKQQVKFFESSPDEVLGVFGKAYNIDDNGKMGKLIGMNAKKIFFKDLFVDGDYLITCTQLLLLENVKSIGFKDGFILEDWYIYNRLLENGGYFLQTDEIYAYYRLHTTNTSKNFYKMVYGGFQVFNEFSYNEYIDKNYIKSALDIIFYNLKKSPLNLFETSYLYLYKLVKFKLKGS